MGYLRVKSKECGYKEKDRILKEQFINDINDDDIITDIIRELKAIKDTETTSEQVLPWAGNVEEQRAQKAIIKAKKGVKISKP